MRIGQVIAQNITDLLSASGEQLKTVHGRAAERGININYPMIAKLGSLKSEAPKNPSLETLDKVVEVLRTIPGHENLEHWMLMKEGYFRGGNSVAGNQITESFMKDFVDELLFAITTMRIMPISEDQYNNLKNVAKFCYMKKLNLDKPESENKSAASA